MIAKLMLHWKYVNVFLERSHEVLEIANTIWIQNPQHAFIAQPSSLVQQAEKTKPHIVDALYKYIMLRLKMTQTQKPLLLTRNLPTSPAI